MKRLLIALTFPMVQLCSAQVTLVGMSSQGGYNNHGTIFTTNSNGTVDILYNFNEGIDGFSPLGSLVQDADGYYYGLTMKGGNSSSGTLFKYHPDYHSITNLGSFSGMTGASPKGSLIMGIDGSLYGMTNTGGEHGFGTLFKCTTDGDLTILLSFDMEHGAFPVGTLTQAKDGSLYGMTRLGGLDNKGIIFKYTLSGDFTVLHTFNGEDGAQPEGALTFVGDTVLYGVAKKGGESNMGTVFKCTPSGNFTLLNSFDVFSGTQPCGSLLYYKGAFFGTTSNGGTNQAGTLFRCSLNGGLKKLADFADTIGINPTGTLMLASDGNMYGVTTAGGKKTTSNAGVIFRFNPITYQFSEVYEFSTAGPMSAHGQLIEVTTKFTASRTLAPSKKAAKPDSSAGIPKKTFRSRATE